jgi:hypothetical protein
VKNNKINIDLFFSLSYSMLAELSLFPPQERARKAEVKNAAINAALKYDLFRNIKTSKKNSNKHLT